MKKRDRNKNAEKTKGKADIERALIEGVFLQIDSEIETSDDPRKKEFLELLDQTEEKVKNMEGKDRDSLISEIYLRKGRCAKGILERGREYRYWKQASEYAGKSKNHEALVQSELALGFTFVEFTSSIREILEIQMDCIRAICNQGTAIHTRLRIMGINLFSFWNELEYRRLSERDLDAKQFVIDGAKSLQKAGFDEERAAPIMILLISRVFDFNDASIEWAQYETAILDLPIPEDVKRKIEPLMHKTQPSE
jgi:hypothetical protein